MYNIARFCYICFIKIIATLQSLKAFVAEVENSRIVGPER